MKKIKPSFLQLAVTPAPVDPLIDQLEGTEFPFEMDPFCHRFITQPLGALNIGIIRVAAFKLYIGFTAFIQPVQYFYKITGNSPVDLPVKNLCVKNYFQKLRFIG